MAVSSDFYYSWRGFGLYSIEYDLKDIFEAVMAIYEQMKYTTVSHGESEQQLILVCRSRLEQMRTIYQKNLPHQAQRMDFTCRIAQWCYMYLYMLRHVHLVHDALKKAIQENVLRVWPNKAPLDVCMIGGGPGSDILGICLLMKEFKCQTPWTNQVFVLDACQQWESSWRRMHDLLPDIFRQGLPKVNYCPFDYRENVLSPKNQERVQKAEVITMIKSLSSAAAWLKNQIYYSEKYINSGGTLKKSLEWHSVCSILKHMQSGAMLLYIDNKTGWQRKILMTAAKHHNMDVLLDFDLREVQMPKSFLACNREFSKKLDWKPCSSAGCNEMIILRKPGHLFREVKLEVAVPNSVLPKENPFSQSTLTNDGLVYEHTYYEKKYTDDFTNLEKNGTSLGNHDFQNSRNQTQTYSSKEWRLIEGKRGPEIFPRNNFEITSETPVKNAPSKNNLRSISKSGKYVPCDSKMPLQLDEAVARSVSREDGDAKRDSVRFSLETCSHTLSPASYEVKQQFNPIKLKNETAYDVANYRKKYADCPTNLENGTTSPEIRDFQNSSISAQNLTIREWRLTKDSDALQIVPQNSSKTTLQTPVTTVPSKTNLKSIFKVAENSARYDFKTPPETGESIRRVTSSLNWGAVDPNSTRHSHDFCWRTCSIDSSASNEESLAGTNRSRARQNDRRPLLNPTTVTQEGEENTDVGRNVRHNTTMHPRTTVHQNRWGRFVHCCPVQPP